MKKDKNFLKENFHFTSLLKPMIYSLVFAAIYNIVYFLADSYITNSLAREVFDLIWVSVYGLSWYFVSTLVWTRKQGTLSLYSCSIVLLWCLLWAIYAVYIVTPLYTYVYLAQNAVLMIIVQLLAAAGLILMIPSSLLLFKGLYEGETSLKTLFRCMGRSMKENASAIFNSWLCLFLLMCAWDSMFYGPLSIYDGFNAVNLLSQLLFLGNPIAYGMLIVYVMGGDVFGGYIYMVVLSLLFGLVLNWLDVNLIAWTGKQYKSPRSL